MNENFWRHVSKGAPEECWEWTGNRSRDNYGKWSKKANGQQKCYSAHRVAYESAKGPIPTGLQIDHLCRNPPCVNPAHLDAVTPKENVLRSVPFWTPESKRRIGNRNGAGNAGRGGGQLALECIRGHARSEHSYATPRGRTACRPCKRIYNQRAWARQRTTPTPSFPEMTK